MTLIKGPLSYELSNGGLGLAMHFDNDEHIHIERHHDRQGRMHDITPIMTSRLSTALEGIRAYTRLRVAPFEEGFVQLFGTEPPMEGSANLAEEVVSQHSEDTVFFSLDGDNGTVFWGKPSLKLKKQSIEYAESAIMLPEFDPELFSEFADVTATSDIRKNAALISEAIMTNLVEITR